MRKTVLLCLLFIVLSAVLPFLGILLGEELFFAQGAQAGPPQSPAASAPAAAPPEPYKILNESSGLVESVAVRDYLIGAVASEMPLSYEDEALLAQIIACHSYAEYVRAANRAAPQPLLLGADFAADPQRHKGYLSEAEMRTVWQAAFEAQYARVSALVDRVLGTLVLYEGKVALTTYFAVSNGLTEASENVWAQALPYLVATSATADMGAPGYLSVNVFTAQEMYEALSSHFSGLDLAGEPAAWFGPAEYSASGYVLSVLLGGAHVSGPDLRAALGLRSASFSVDYDTENECFTITVKGYGHGVGLSQFAANTMALTGKTYAEILAHFYPGTTLS